MSFDKLIADLGVLAKAMPAAAVVDDGAAAAAAAAPAKADAKPEGEDALMSKSFSFTLADGSTVEAVDGTDLVKALVGRVEKAEGDLAKALEQIPAVMSAQNALIKSAIDRIAELSGQGRGRKAVLSVSEKPDPAGASTLAKAEEQGMGAVEFLAKAEGAFKARKISGHELATCETFLNKGMQIPAPLAAKVLG